jgi:hypothetical protein
MAYCDIDDVYAVGVHGSQTYDENTTPTEDQVEFAIDDIAEEIDGKLYSAGVSVPIILATSPKAYAKLTRLNAIGAAAYAESITWREINTRSPESDKNTPSYYQKRFEERLKWYCEAPDRLEDAIPSANALNSDTITGSVTYSGVVEKYDFDYVDALAESDVKPYFRHDDEW